MSNQSRIIYSLCEVDRNGSGSWSQPYQEDGYTVRRFDIQNPDPVDVRFLKYVKEPVYGILAAPVCTQFAVSGNRFRAIEKEAAPSLFGQDFASEYDEKMAGALALVDACIRQQYIRRDTLRFFALENPVGTLVNYLGPPRFLFNPNEFAGWLDRPGEDPDVEAYTKKTLLWGDFNKPRCREVEAVHGSMMHTNYGGKSQATKNARSKTPTGFARAFHAANP